MNTKPLSEWTLAEVKAECEKYAICSPECRAYNDCFPVLPLEKKVTAAYQHSLAEAVDLALLESLDLYEIIGGAE